MRMCIIRKTVSQMSDNDVMNEYFQVIVSVSHKCKMKAASFNASIEKKKITK